MTGAELKAARKSLGMTQAQLAQALEVSVSQLHNWEHGVNRGHHTVCVVPRRTELAVGALFDRNHQERA